MQREIKFRGKSIESGEWAYGYLVINKHMGVTTYHILKDMGKVYATSKEVTPETVGQFTGLLDKTGKEIYEGDIIEYYSMDDKIFASVKYEQQACQYWLIHNQGSKHLYRALTANQGGEDYYADYTEIIGNIHEHTIETIVKKS